MTDRRRFRLDQTRINEDGVVKDRITAAMHCSKCTNTIIAAKKKKRFSELLKLIDRGALT